MIYTDCSNVYMQKKYQNIYENDEQGSESSFLSKGQEDQRALNRNISHLDVFFVLNVPRATEMTLWVKYLLCMHEDLNFHPQDPHKSKMQWHTSGSPALGREAEKVGATTGSLAKPV